MLNNKLKDDAESVKVARDMKSENNYCAECGREKKQWSSSTICLMCRVKGGSTIFKPNTVDDDFGNWLMGFVDGEGNFQCIDKSKTNAKRCDVMFRIVLREDDKPILDEIRERLGCGKLFYRNVQNHDNWNPKYKSKNMRNQWCFKVGNSYDLVKIVIPIFDKYGLRSKKEKQYEVWKEKVLDKWIKVVKKGIKGVG